jgi:hypothetical protein
MGAVMTDPTHLTLIDVAIMPAEAARRIGLPARDHASFFLTGPAGEHVTGIGDDVGYLELLVSAGGESLVGLQIPREKCPLLMPGWPDDWMDEFDAQQRGDQNKISE